MVRHALVAGVLERVGDNMRVMMAFDMPSLDHLSVEDAADMVGTMIREGVLDLRRAVNLAVAVRSVDDAGDLGDVARELARMTT